MGDISIIARRLEGGAQVQYGWGGNGGYYSMVGERLLAWYDDPEKVEYLFGLGQMVLIGKPEGERSVFEPPLFRNVPEGTPHWIGKSEREIFSKIAYISYGYFYDLDDIWYYIVPGPFRIKIPLKYLSHHLDERGYEFDEIKRIGKRIAEYILHDYYAFDSDFRSHIQKEYPQGIEEIEKDVLSADVDDPCHHIWDKYKAIFQYFDDWIVVKSNDENDITGIVVHKNQVEQGGNRIETINW